MPSNYKQPQLTQQLVDNCQLIGIRELANRLYRKEATIRTQVSREPNKLPPRFPIPGSNQVVWMLATVINWMLEQQQKSDSFCMNNTADVPMRNSRRGAPSAKEKIDARNAGMSVTQYRLSINNANSSQQ